MPPRSRVLRSTSTAAQIVSFTGGPMVNAYILVQQDRRGSPLASLLRPIPGVQAAEDTTGAYDAVVLACAESVRSLLDDVVEAIKRIPHVTRSITAPLLGSAATAGVDPVVGGATVQAA